MILLLLGTVVYATVSRSLVDQVDRDLMSRNRTELNGSGTIEGGRPHPPERDGYRGGTFSLSLGANGDVEANPQQVLTEGISWPTAQAGGTLTTVTMPRADPRISQRGV